ncbi:MAG: YIP1 family protein [Candidatus Izemoplasmatales bacterium]
MKKTLLVVLVLLSSLAFVPLLRVEADTAFWHDHYPYDTYTVDYRGTLTYTQTAYVPLGVLNEPGTLLTPEDLFIKDGLVYVADGGHKRVAVFDADGTLVAEIGADVLDVPTGVFVSDEFVYVADKGAALVFKFALDGTLVRTYGRPVEPLFGASSLYVPAKVVVGAGENIYVIGDGSTSGVIQLNYDGSFLGYFGVNLSEKSLIQKIADVFVIGDEYAKSTPPSPTNVAISAKSLVYTSTPNTARALKKLDVNGNNILTMANYDVENDVVDLAVDALGYLYAIYDDGLVVEYDPAGNLLFAFDVTASTGNVVGQLGSPTAIAVDEDRILYCLDGASGAIVAYAPTDFADLVHAAIGLYNDGTYAESTGMFEAILRQNANFALARAALGKAYYQNGDYEAALAEYRLASDVAGYSETYWKIRDGWLKQNLSAIFIVVIALSILGAVLRRIDAKTAVFAGVRAKADAFLARPAVKRYTLAVRILKRPADAFFRIKRLREATPGSATVLLVLLFAEYLFMIRTTGFVFNRFPEEVNLFASAAVFFGAFFLYVFANYLVSTLSDGEGWLRDVYVASAYALSPLLFGWIPLALLSNVLTLNESILFELSRTVLYGWTAVLVFLSAKEIHNYEIGETAKNLIVTLFAVLIIVLIGFIVYVFGSELWDFVMSWVKELIGRVVS